MWKLLENGDELKIGDKLRHQIIFGKEDEKSIQEYEIIAVENIYYSAKLICIDGKPVPIYYQFTWLKEISKLSESKLQIWVKTKKEKL